MADGTRDLVGGVARGGTRRTTGTGPSQAQLVLPLIELLVDAGRPMRAKAAAGALADRFELSPDQRARVSVDRNGRSHDVWERHVRFARLKAAALGYLVPDGAGWVASDVAREGLALRRHGITVTVGPGGDPSRPLAAQFTIDGILPSVHTLVHGDARELGWIPSDSVALSVTSVPYFDLKSYSTDEAQLAAIGGYEPFLDELEKVIREIARILVPGGRLACNVGDVLRSRKAHGSHHVLPLHADLLTRGRAAGLEALTGIVWEKVGNRTSEGGGPGFLGRPGQPNAIVPAGVEHILMLRKPGGYRTATEAMRRDSAIGGRDHARWFRAVWSDVPGERTSRGHPAPYPVEIPERLIRMFSFRGDTVVDPFAGSGTTAVAAARAGRDSVSVEVSDTFFALAAARMAKATEAAPSP